MQVILLERIGRLGQMGDVVNVKDGYARNFLLPQKKALRATEDNLARFEGQRAQLEARDLELKKEAEAVAGKLQGKTFLAIRQAGEESIDIYGETFLIERPMLAVLRAPDSTVLLIDEIDRADQEFEAFLLEFLSDFQISIPERGTVRAAERPVVVLTSNRTRDLHEALRRRCVYHWIDYPTAEREARIVMMRASSVAESTARAVVAAVGKLRREPLSKAPGIAEAVDWAEAATLLHERGARWPDAFKRSIGVALKDEEDLTYISSRLDALIAEAAA